MTVLHSGTTKKYSANWDKVFKGGKTKGAEAKKASTTKKAAAKKPAKKAKK